MSGGSLQTAIFYIRAYINSLFVILLPALDLKWSTVVKTYFPKPLSVGILGFKKSIMISPAEIMSSAHLECCPNTGGFLLVSKWFEKPAVEYMGGAL